MNPNNPNFRKTLMDLFDAIEESREVDGEELTDGECLDKIYDMYKEINIKHIDKCVEVLEDKKPEALQEFVEAAMPFIEYDDLNEDELVLRNAYYRLIGIEPDAT